MRLGPRDPPLLRLPLSFGFGGHNAVLILSEYH
jgi:3-oxoacyl-(acyl-carrier-protein) synthase